MMKYILIAMLLPLSSQAIGLLDSMEISAAGMKVQSKRISVVTQNIANADATGITPGSEPYRRKIIFFKVKKDFKRGIDIVEVDKVGRDRSDFEIRFEPKHPAANEQGYVLYPNVDRIVENMDAKEAQRSYEANMNALEITKSMINKTFDILR